MPDNPPAPPLPEGTRVGTVHLRVTDLHGTAAFYEEVLGMEVLAEDAATAALGKDRRAPPLVVLHQGREARPAPSRTPGLFHMAFLVPDRRALAALIRRVQDMDWPFTGFADHNVSEAAYLSDPEGNGIELYADRDPDVWRTVDGEIFITTEPLDLDGLLRVAGGAAAALPADTRVGHVHLRVSSLAAAEEFYVRRLGLGVVTRRIRGALFVAAGRYHHHVGLNVWSRADTPRAEDAPGLMAFELVVPDAEARRRLTGGADEGLLTDPDAMGVRICRSIPTGAG